MTGNPLGPRRKSTAANEKELKARRKQLREDEIARIPVEGKLGNAKRKGTLDRVMAKLARTSESVIHVAIVTLNLDTWLRAGLSCLLGAACVACEALFLGLRRPLALLVGLGFPGGPPKLAQI